MLTDLPSKKKYKKNSLPYKRYSSVEISLSGLLTIQEFEKCILNKTLNKYFK
jgi:hypothetical protein